MDYTDPLLFPKHLAEHYKAGATLRSLGAEIGITHTTVLYYLRKLPTHRAMVSRVLLNRLRKAEVAYSIARSRANRKKLRHAFWMLRRVRPRLLKNWLERRGPDLPGAVIAFGLEYRASCPACSSPRSVFARRESAGAWAWDCGRCGAEGTAGDRASSRRSAKRQTGTDTGTAGSQRGGALH
jgi:hypothetical protein